MMFRRSWGDVAWMFLIKTVSSYLDTLVAAMIILISLSRVVAIINLRQKTANNVCDTTWAYSNRFLIMLASR